ncbi:hypothetical protein F9B74_04245 [Pelistega sp. NLN82]|uniref:TPM domain-containing protein n=1 Tax=Pelistega ratti TaxID=2652177 RepID=A0A6L9Y6X9_9BURK|nr:TPM domain-containing protein [Pelistega ratti]NEN75538.1 hypothetical protein [Pelistega ratti]
MVLVVLGAAASVEAVAAQVVVEVLQVAGKWLNQMGLTQFYGVYLKHKFFTDALLQRLSEAIQASEQNHAGELVLAIEVQSPKDNLLSHERALEVFGRLKVWDTPYRTGVLLYLNLSLQTIEIIADRGIEVSNTVWEEVCTQLSQHLANKDYEKGLQEAIVAIEQVLINACGHLPVNTPNALSDKPVVL